MTSQGLALRAAVAGLLLLLPLRALGEPADVHHEVSLLQAEVLTKARSANQHLAEEKRASIAKQPSCEACETGAPLTVGAACDLKGSMEAPYLSEPPAPAAHSHRSDRQDVGAAATEAAAESRAEAEQASPTPLGLVLEVLIVALLFDGIRRSQKPKSEEKGEDQEVQARRISQPSEAFNELMRAALAGDAKLCGKLLQGVSRVVGEDVWGCTALHAAAKGGSVDVVQRLLSIGACVHSCDAWDETPLHIAARAGFADVCDLLLAHGANVDAINAQDWTPLVAAADAGQRAACDLLLARGAGTAGLPDEALPPLIASLAEQREEEAGEVQKDVVVNPFEELEETYGDSFGSRRD